jgi:hypothetical protein
VSSILKALKKLENETGQQTSLVDSVDTKKTIRRSFMGTWLFYSVISALITIGILIGGGWILLRQKPMLTKLLHTVSSEEKKEIPKPEPQKATRPPIVRTESVIAKSSDIPAASVPDKKPEPPKQRVAMPEKPIIVPKPGEIVIPPRPVPSRTVQDIPRSVEEIPPPPAESENSTGISPEAEKAITDEVLSEIEAAKSAPQPSAASPQVPEKQAEKNITDEVVSEIEATKPAPQQPSAASSRVPEKQIEGLGIQALVWSENPKSRMVMMNNQILHIGDMMDRFHVKDIGSDFVVLSEGNQEWKMKFHVK